MDIRKLVLSFGIVLLSFSGPACAQAGLKRASTSPFKKQMVIEFANGTVAIADDSTQRIYISAKSGQQYEVPFTDAIASVESSPTKRQKMLRQFRASLSDSGHMVTISAPRIATDQSLWPRYEWCGEVVCIDPFNSRVETNSAQVLGSAYSVSSCNHYLCPDLPFPCDMGPCSPNKWGSGLTFYSSSLAGWGGDQGGGNVTQQDLVAYDKKLWEHHRQEACTEKNIAAASTSATGAATVAACALSELGVPVLGCAAGIIGYGIGLYQTNKKTKECFADYPGMDNW